MPLFLKNKNLDLSSGGELFIILNSLEANHWGIRAGDRVTLIWSQKKISAIVELSDKRVKPGQIGLFKEIWRPHRVKKRQIIKLELVSRPPSIKAIKKKLFGKPLNYQEMKSIVEDIAQHRLGRIETTYFVASSFIKNYSLKELYYLTKAMAETGDMIKFPGKKVVDKHSVGGLSGNRTSMIVIPILASLGLYSPKTSSRAITSPSGTADTMEVLSPVSFTTDKIKKMVEKNHACLVWGGGLNLAPADDKIIKVSYPLDLEPYDKMIVSIMAKKVATDVDYLVIDMPIGPTTKVPNLQKGREIEKKFLYLGKMFNIKTKVVMIEAREPVGRGIGPALEARDVLRVLQQKSYRPIDLEKKSLILTAKLLELCGRARRGMGYHLAQRALKSGCALKKMREIIKIQGGNQRLDSEQITPSAITHRYYSDQSGQVTFINNRAVDEICRILGAPIDKLAGIYLHRRVGDQVGQGWKMFTLYAQSRERIKLAKEAFKQNKIFRIES